MSIIMDSLFCKFSHANLRDTYFSTKFDAASAQLYLKFLPNNDLNACVIPPLFERKGDTNVQLLNLNLKLPVGKAILVVMLMDKSK